MASTPNPFAIACSIALVLTLAHTTLHVALYGTGIPGFYESGVSGFSVGPLEANDEFQRKYGSAAPLSLILVALEWIIVVGTFLGAAAKRTESMQREAAGIDLAKYYQTSKTKTELDVLYALLQDKQQLRISTITKVFNISRAMALEWSNILEQGDLAVLQYPRMGEPSLVAKVDTHEAKATP